MPLRGLFATLIKTASTLYASFSDTFNRTTSGSLGTSSSGGIWKAVSGVWSANGAAATTATPPSSYPIATAPMTSKSATVSLNVGSLAVISASGTVGSITTLTSGWKAVITGLSSTAGISAGDWITATNGTGSIYGGTPSDVQIISVDSASQITYATQGGTTPVAGSVTNVTVRINDGGAGAAVWVTDANNWWGVVYGRSINTSCDCATCSGNACSSYSYSVSSYCASTTYTCNSYASYTAYAYSCTGSSANYSVSYAYSYYSGQVAVYSVSGYTCTTYGTTSSGTYTFCTSANGYCNSGYTSYSLNCNSYTTYYASCNCSTCYPSYVRVLQSASSAVSTIVSFTTTTLAAGLKVIANAATKVLTIRAYSDWALGNQIGTDLTYTASTATPTNNFGILIAPSDYVQGSTLDNVTITSN